MRTSLRNEFERRISYSDFDEFRTDLNNDIKEALEKLPHRDHYQMVLELVLAGESFYCDKCLESIDADDNEDTDEEPGTMTR